MTTQPVVTLRTLGPVALDGPDRPACARVLAQAKRLALLAYLSARPSGERVSRDVILATFWPELDARRARANLRNALYFLRDSLGTGIIVGNEAAVSVAPDRLACDASCFLSPDVPGSLPSLRTQSRGSSTSDDPDQALLDLYRGEFLDGLHVSGTPDFERWVDRVRATVRARATDLAWRLSARSEEAGEWISAAGHARRAVELAVDVEGATQRLIRLLDRAGDRGAALAAYEVLTQRLAEDFEIPPSPETESLVEEIRHRRDRTRPHPPGRGEETPHGPPSLAVLPFEDLSKGPGTYLAEGVCEDLLTALARIHGVRVVSRTSVRRFSSAPPASIGEVRELLGVDLVLEGSVQVYGDRVRITAQLIDAARDAHVWGQSYDRPLADVFEAQSDVALRVARALEAELSPREHDRLRRPPTLDSRAWQLYLRGRKVWANRDPAAADEAERLFLAALDLDTRFAQAWVGLADARLVKASTGAASLSDTVAAAKDALSRALDCDPELGEAHASMGILRTFLEPDLTAARRDYRRAIELSPGYASAHQWYGNSLCALGEAEEGLSELALAFDLDPLAPAVGDSLGLGYYHLGRIDEAEAIFRDVLAHDPGFWRGHLSLAMCHWSRGDVAAATEAFVEVWAGGGYGATPREALEARSRLGNDVGPALEILLASARSRLSHVPGIRVPEILLLMLAGRDEEALAAMEAARVDGSLGFILMYAPALDPLSNHPAFRSTMEGAGMWLPRWPRSSREAHP